DLAAWRARIEQPAWSGPVRVRAARWGHQRGHAISLFGRRHECRRFRGRMCTGSRGWRGLLALLAFPAARIQGEPVEDVGERAVVRSTGWPGPRAHAFVIPPVRRSASPRNPATGPGARG